MLNFSSFLTTKKESKLTNTLLRGLALFYLVYLIVVFFEVLKGGSYLVFSPDHIYYFFIFIIIFELGGALLISFSRYFVLFLSFASMRGIVDNLNYNVNYLTPIAFDQFLFGGEISTKVFQDHFLQFSPALDAFALFVYTWHFYLPFFFGMLLWWKSKKLYDPYFLALTITFIHRSLLTFFVVPVAPPWLASEHGLVDIHHLTFETGPTLGWNSLPSIYKLFNANEVAAFPSLHFAFPILISIFAFQAFGKKALPVLIYPVLMAFSLIYLGEHYVLDLLGGFIYASVGVALSYYIIDSYSKSPISVLLNRV